MRYIDQWRAERREAIMDTLTLWSAPLTRGEIAKACNLTDAMATAFLAGMKRHGAVVDDRERRVCRINGTLSKVWRLTNVSRRKAA